MKSLRETVRAAWKRDRAPFLIFAFGFLYAAIFAQGIPLWDDDFTSWFWKVKDQSIFRYLWEWIWPVSTQPQYWGFNERPAQAFLYKFFYLISGYESWSYFLFKDLVYGTLGLTIFTWVRELGGRRIAGAAAAVLFVTAPNPMAAHFLHGDLAPLAELLVASLLLWAFREVEATPKGWKGLPDLAEDRERAWLVRWLIFSGCVYLSYKTKGDTRVIPMALGLYVLLVRPRQWLYFAVPLGAMILLAVPWGPGLFSKLPPWMPGSSGSDIGWMYQPASTSRVLDFVFPHDGFGIFSPLSQVPLSLAGIFGPFLILPMLLYLVLRESLSKDGITLFPPNDKRSRGILFLWIWTAGMFAVVSALPELNWVFRVRYGIITILPVTILIGLLIDSLIADISSPRRSPQLKRVLVGAASVVLVLQLGLNFVRSAKHRRDLGSVMNAVDKVYEEVAARHSDSTLVMLPDFRPYDYRPGVSRAIADRKWLASPQELKQYPADRTVVISWNLQFGGEFEFLGTYSGCRSTSIFDLLYPCESGSGANLFRYVGERPELKKAEALKAAGKLEEAASELEPLLQKYPGHLGARFALGLIAYQARNAQAMEEVFAQLEVAAPRDTRVLYNHGLALLELGKPEEAVERLERVLEIDPGQAAAKQHLARALAAIKSK